MVIPPRLCNARSNILCPIGISARLLFVSITKKKSFLSNIKSISVGAILLPLNIGNNVSIGHRAIVHGCTIEDNVLIGMGAIVMDHAVIHSNTLIAAGAIVLENTICESGMIYAGIPAKAVKKLEPEVFEHNIRRIADNYVMYSSWMK